MCTVCKSALPSIAKIKFLHLLWNFILRNVKNNYLSQCIVPDVSEPGPEPKPAFAQGLGPGSKFCWAAALLSQEPGAGTSWHDCVKVTSTISMCFICLSFHLLIIVPAHSVQCDRWLGSWNLSTDFLFRQYLTAFWALKSVKAVDIEQLTCGHRWTGWNRLVSTYLRQYQFEICTVHYDS